MLALLAPNASSESASAATGYTTIPGFNHLKPVFRANGFPAYKSTYVRCYSDVEWRKVRRGHHGLMGWYDGGVWIHVRAATCTNALKALNRGQTSYTNIVAVATLIHETIHRQGIKNERVTECLSTWLAAHAVHQWTGSVQKALRTLALARKFGRDRLPMRYQTTDAQCVSIAFAFGVQPIAEEDPPYDPPPSPPPPPTPPPVTEHLVGYEVGDYVSVSDGATRVPPTHKTITVWYTTVGPYEIDIRLSGASGTYGGKYRAHGVGEITLALPGGWPGLNSGPLVLVSAVPEFAFVLAHPGQAKIELRVVTRP